MSKGSGRRPEAAPGAYASGYDRIKWSERPTCEDCGVPLKRLEFAYCAACARTRQDEDATDWRSQ